jgi:2-keto-4-pentenoate hydratase
MPVMALLLAPADEESIASEMLGTLADARSIAPFSFRNPGFSLDDAYRTLARLRELRIAGGETVVGRKIGFTNRTIWVEYGVYAPMWGYMYARPLEAGEIVTTGPLTRAFPVKAGETWSTALHGIALGGLHLRFS